MGGDKKVGGVGWGGGRKRVVDLIVLVCFWVEIWILKSVEKMGGAILGLGKILFFMISYFG
jgi:hypothetical protein